MPSWQWITLDNLEHCVAQPLPSIMKEMKECRLVPEMLWCPCCSGWCGDQSHQKSHCTWQTHGGSSEVSVWGHITMLPTSKLAHFILSLLSCRQVIQGIETKIAVRITLLCWKCFSPPRVLSTLGKTGWMLFSLYIYIYKILNVWRNFSDNCFLPCLILSIDAMFL